mgnify:CR=1 FL=1
MSDSHVSLADLFLDVAEGKRVEGLKEELQAAGAPGKTKTSPSRMAQKLAEDLPEDLADIPHELEIIEHKENPYEAYSLLSELRQRLDNYSEAADDESLDDAHEEVRELVDARYQQLRGNWGEDALSLLDELVQQLHRARESVRMLIGAVEDHAARDTDVDAPPLTDNARRLENMMDDIEETAAEIPDLNLKDIHVWTVLTKARERIAEPHRRNVFLFKCAVLMARADGELSSVEENFLYSIADRIHLSRTEAQVLVEESRQISPSDFHGSPHDALQAIHKLYLCALADGVVHGSEKRMLMRLASTLGVSEDEVEAVVAGTQPDHSIDFLDTKVLRDYLQSLPSLPENTYISDDMTPQRREELIEELSIPPEEDILLSYENRFLGRLYECAALTTRHLYLAPPNGKPASVALSSLEGFSSRIRSTTVELWEGSKISLSRSAEGFLELVNKCLQETLPAL